MALQTKQVKIADKEITIIQFNVTDAWEERGKLSKFLIKNNISFSNQEEAVINIMGALFGVPITYIMSLLRNCSCEGLGLNDEQHLNNVFAGNMDAILELAIEVIKFNGFFSASTLTSIEKLMAQPTAEAETKSKD